MNKNELIQKCISPFIVERSEKAEVDCQKERWQHPDENEAEEKQRVVYLDPVSIVITQQVLPHYKAAGQHQVSGLDFLSGVGVDLL